MDVSTKKPAVSLVVTIVAVLIAAVSTFIAFKAVRQAEHLQQEQWKRDELALRRDVLRRLFAYRYRLTESLAGKDGEPFIALNEAFVVYADFPKVTKALTRMHDQLESDGHLIRNIVALVRAMADAANISVQDLDDGFIERPFTPPAPARNND